MSVSLRALVKIGGIVTVLVLPQLLAGGAAAGVDKACVKDSEPAPPPAYVNRINSAPCGKYGELITRATTTAGQSILIRYMVHTPSPKAKGIVVLIPGGILQAGITGDPITGQVFTAGQNFLVRSAQLFAEDGYVALTLGRPLKVAPGVDPVPEFPDEGEESAQWFHHRISPRHAFDIVRVLAQVNTANLPLFLAGTSSGAISAVGQHMLGSGILLSSSHALMSPPFPSPLPTVPGCPPATNCGLYVNHPSVPRLQPASVTVPTHVLVHQQEICLMGPPNSLALHNAFVAAGIDSRFDVVTGGFVVPGEDACSALSFHGYLGAENRAVKSHTKRLDEILANIDKLFKGNRKPVALPGLIAPAGPPYVIDLATLASDPGDILTYSLPHLRSYRVALDAPLALTNLSLAGSVVTYTPPAPGPLTDGFTYVVSDGKGGVSTSYVIVNVP